MLRWQFSSTKTNRSWCKASPAAKAALEAAARRDHEEAERRAFEEAEKKRIAEEEAIAAKEDARRKEIAAKRVELYKGIRWGTEESRKSKEYRDAMMEAVKGKVGGSPEEQRVFFDRVIAAHPSSSGSRVVRHHAPEEP